MNIKKLKIIVNLIHQNISVEKVEKYGKASEYANVVYLVDKKNLNSTNAIVRAQKDASCIEVNSRISCKELLKVIIDNSNEEYLLFVDEYTKIDLVKLQKLFTQSEINRADLIFFNYSIVSGKTFDVDQFENIKNVHLNQLKNICNISKSLSCLRMDLCNKLYSINFLKQSKINEITTKFSIEKINLILTLLSYIRKPNILRVRENIATVNYECNSGEERNGDIGELTFLIEQCRKNKNLFRSIKDVLCLSFDRFVDSNESALTLRRSIDDSLEEKKESQLSLEDFVLEEDSNSLYGQLVHFNNETYATVSPINEKLGNVSLKSIKSDNYLVYNKSVKSFVEVGIFNIAKDFAINSTYSMVKKSGRFYLNIVDGGVCKFLCTCNNQLCISSMNQPLELECAEKANYISTYSSQIALLQEKINAVSVFKEKHNVPVIYITDHNFVLPTSISIYSLIQSASSFFEIFVLMCECDANDVLVFERLGKHDNVKINIIDVSSLNSSDNVTELDIHVSTAAVIKFFIPLLFSNYEKVLYIDGDTLVLKDLSDITKYDIADNYIGAVSDINAFYYKKKYYADRLKCAMDNYYNSGVMLFNIKNCLADDISNKLFEYRIRGINDFMDQDALNVVMNHRICSFPLSFNTISTCVRYADIEHVKKYYPNELSYTDDYLSTAYIYHYASPEKPWKYNDVYLGNIWYKYYLDSNLYPKLPDLISFRVKSNQYDFDNVAISIIIPVYNASKYISPCLDSILGNKKINNIEVLCIDDGSTDDSFFILKKYESNDSRVKVFSQKNKYAGVARNVGISHAKGEYILFIDADDKLYNGDNLLFAYNEAVKHQADIAVCKATSINSIGKTTGECGWCLRESYLPAKQVFNKNDIGPFLFFFTSGAPWGKLYKLSFIKSNFINFPPLKRSEDFFFVEQALTLASRIIAVPKFISSYRMIEGSPSLENTKDETPLIFSEAEKMLEERLKELKVYDSVEIPVKLCALNRIVYNLHAMKTYSGFLQIFNKLRELYEHQSLPHGLLDLFSLSYLYNKIEYALSQNPEDYWLYLLNSKK